MLQGPYATGTELRVATVKDLLEVRNGGNAATAELYGGWADMAWEVAGEQEDADMYAVNQEINRLQQRQYFIPMQQVFFQPGQPGHRWWKPSEAELSRKLLGECKLCAALGRASKLAARACVGLAVVHPLTVARVRRTLPLGGAQGSECATRCPGHGHMQGEDLSDHGEAHSSPGAGCMQAAGVTQCW